MAVTSVTNGRSEPETTNVSARAHPLLPLQASEVTAASSTLKSILGRDVRCKSIFVQEPLKALLFPYLEAEAAGTPPQLRPYVPRWIGIIHSTDNERDVCYSVIDLDSKTLVSAERPPRGQHSPNDR